MTMPKINKNQAKVVSKNLVSKINKIGNQMESRKAKLLMKSNTISQSIVNKSMTLGKRMIRGSILNMSKS